MTNQSRHVCCKCGHSSALKSNFKYTPDGKAYCVKKCLDTYYDVNWNEGARIKGDKA